jgi:hypothetical protein
MTVRSFLMLTWLLAACTTPGAPPVEAPAPEPQPAPALQFPYEYVWTRDANTPLRTDSGEVMVPRLFTRLRVTGTDSLGLLVECPECSAPGAGWLDTARVVYTAAGPEAEAGGDLPSFLLAVRNAAVQRDVAKLRGIMDPEFTFSFGPAGGRLEAFAAWEQEGFRSLDQLPMLLDRGVVSQDERIWVASPEYLGDASYFGLRAGFRREDGKWVWLFLVRGD